MRFNLINFLFERRKIIFTVLFFLLIGLTVVNVICILDSPEDYLQGESVKIMYLHVPFAWVSLGMYMALTSSCVLYIIYRSVQFWVISKAIAPVGLLFTILTLVTGSLWGKPTWGAYWVWDARLTSMLFLAFIYLGYITIISSGGGSKIPLISSYYAVFGCINIPIIKFSVNIWNTLHQGASVITATGIKIHDAISKVLLLAFFEILLLCFTMVVINICIQMVKVKINKIKRIASAMAVLLVCSIAATDKANAGTWSRDKGELYTSTSVYYAGRYSFNNNGESTDGAANDVSYDTYNKIRSKGFSELVEYGVNSKLTLTGQVQAYAIEDILKLTAVQNDVSAGSFTIKSHYWAFDPSVSARYQFYKGDKDASSVELMWYAGTYFSGKRDHFDARTGQLVAWFGYARAFTSPFGLKTKPEDGSYFDLRVGPGWYPEKGKADLSTTAEIGFAPINDKWQFIFSLDSTFNGYDPLFRPLSKSTINAAVSGLAISNANKTFVTNNLYNQMKSDSTGDYHQAGFQLGYKFNDKTTVYAKTYTNVFDSKPFHFNSFYLSLDYTY